MNCTGVILAGGQSSRMGRPKALLEYRGTTLIERTSQLMARLCPEVLIVTRAEVAPLLKPVTSLPLFEDPCGSRGPLAGLRAGLAAAAHPHILAVACDMPLLSAAALQLVRDQEGRWDVVLPRHQGFPQPLHARYHRRCLPAMDRVLAGGTGRVARILPGLQVLSLEESVWGEVPGFAESLASVDTPESWDQLLSRKG